MHASIIWCTLWTTASMFIGLLGQAIRLRAFADLNLPYLYFAPLFLWNFAEIFCIRKLESLGYCMSLFA